MTSAAERFESHQWIATKVSRGLLGRFGAIYTYDELYAMALVGLWDCAEKYVDDGRAKFTTYARGHVPLRVIDQIRSERGRLHGNHLDAAKRAVWEPADGQIAIDEHTVIDLVEAISASDDPAYEEVELSMVFEEYLASLKPRMREAVRLRLEGLKLAEIGERMGVTESRVSQWFHRMRPDLERRLHAVV